jgi:tetratricopeptide (TPR) repeat protein
MTRQESLGERVRNLRVRQGLSQAELAFPELSDSYVSLIEGDKRVPARAVIELLARKLGCSSTYLETGVDDEAVAELRVALEYGQIALQNGEAGEARVSFAKAISSPDLAALPELMFEAHWGYARALEVSGELEEATAELDRLTTTISPESDPDRWAWLHIALCRCHRERGDFQLAAEVGELGLKRLIETSGGWSEGMVMLGATLLGVSIERGDLVHARQFADRLIDRADQVGSPRAMAAAYWNAGVAADYRGDVVEALRLEERALALLGESDDTRNLARLRGECGRTMLRAQPEQAQQAWELIRASRHEMAASDASEIDDARGAADLANVEIALGRPDTAVALAEDAIKRLGDEPRFALAEVLVILAHSYIRLDRLEDAVSALRGAAEKLEGMQSSRQAAQAWFELAELHGMVGDTMQQAVAYRRACSCLGI